MIATSSDCVVNHDDMEATQPPSAPSEVSSCGPPTASDRDLVEALVNSKIYRDYACAFSVVTGLPVALRPVESWNLAHHGKRNEAPFCALMAQKSRSCAACLEVQGKLLEAAREEPHTLVCQAGLTETAVPVRLGGRLIGFLQTGQIFLESPTESRFGHVSKLVSDWGVDVDRVKLREAYFGTRVVLQQQHASVIRLLSVFAQHLSLVSNQILLRRRNAEPPMVAKAKAFILEHHTEVLRLARVAKFVNTSPFWFCKMFKKGTGLNFIDYVTHIRVEHSKRLLANSNMPVCEIASEVGFQSLNHFNRIFKKTLGHSPTWYRSQWKGKVQPSKSWGSN
jgi:AraC-like DNA-binding protein/ligand-binding sensor protein